MDLSKHEPVCWRFVRKLKTRASCTKHFGADFEVEVLCGVRWPGEHSGGWFGRFGLGLSDEQAQVGIESI